MTTIVVEGGVYIHHIPQESSDPDAEWRALCGAPMPLDHHTVRRRGEVRICTQCGLIFQVLRHRRNVLAQVRVFPRLSARGKRGPV